MVSSYVKGVVESAVRRDICIRNFFGRTESETLKNPAHAKEQVIRGIFFE